MRGLGRFLARAVVLGALASGSGVHAKLSVLTTTADLAALAEAIGGDRVTVAALARPTEDPHFVDPKPSFVVRLNRADLLVEGGAELEAGWLGPLLQGARNPKLASGSPGHLAAASGLEMLEVPEILDRSQGDLHAAGNPHFLMDPLNAQRVARRIAEALAVLDPPSADRYRANYARFSDQLEAKMLTWQQRLEPHRGRSIVAYHNIWPYFGRRFGLHISLFLEPKPGIPPTPASLAEVVARMKTEKIKLILVEPFQSRRTAERAAEETGALVLDVTQYPGGLKGTEGGYIELMDYLVNSIANALDKVGK